MIYGICDTRSCSTTPWMWKKLLKMVRSFGMIVYKQIAGDEDPKEIILNEVDIWVRVYDIPKGFVSGTILQSIANYIGCFVKSDPVNLNGV